MCAVANGDAEELRDLHNFAAVSGDAADRLQSIRDDMIRALFAITLDLGSAMELTDDRGARAKISEVIDKTDELIREVRNSALEAIPFDGASPGPSAASPE